MANLLDPYGQDTSTAKLSTTMSILQAEFANITNHYAEFKTKYPGLEPFNEKIFLNSINDKNSQLDQSILKEFLSDVNLTFAEFSILVRNRIQRLVSKPLTIEEVGKPSAFLAAWVKTIINLIQSLTQDEPTSAIGFTVLNSSYATPEKHGTMSIDDTTSSMLVDGKTANLINVLGLQTLDLTMDQVVYTPTGLRECLTEIISSLGDTIKKRAPFDYQAYMKDEVSSIFESTKALMSIWEEIESFIRNELEMSQAKAKINYELAMRLKRTNPIQIRSDPKTVIAKEIVAVASDMGYSIDKNDGKFKIDEISLGIRDNMKLPDRIEHLSKLLNREQ